MHEQSYDYSFRMMTIFFSRNDNQIDAKAYCTLATEKLLEIVKDRII